MKTLLSSMLALLFAVTFTVTPIQAADEIGEITLSYAELNPDTHPMGAVAHFFADKVKELSGGKMTINVYTSGMLGSEKECLQALQIGGGFM